jgi:hypothetical protein
MFTYNDRSVFSGLYTNYAVQIVNCKKNRHERVCEEYIKKSNP